MDLGLRDKVALVTAASSGIGLATAERLAAEGATVAVNARSAEGLERAAKIIGAAGGTVTVHAADLTSAAETARLLEEVHAAHGPLDVLVVNTGGPPLRPVLDTTLDDWDAAYQLLLRPAVQLAQGAAARMAERGSGSVVFLTSTWVKQPKVGGVLSASLRSAVSALAKQMALELAASGVRVNQVVPGATLTPRIETIVAAAAQRNGTSPEEELARVVAEIPAGRAADAAEVAAAVAFLASPASSHTTGAVLQVDGGAIRSIL